MPVVRIDHTSGMAAMLESLSAMGAARIGYMINRAEEVRQDHRWLSGIDLYRHRVGKARVSTLLLRSRITEKRLRAWIAERQIDVLICSHDLFQQTEYLEGRWPGPLWMFPRRRSAASEDCTRICGGSGSMRCAR